MFEIPSLTLSAVLFSVNFSHPFVLNYNFEFEYFLTLTDIRVTNSKKISCQIHLYLIYFVPFLWEKQEPQRKIKTNGNKRQNKRKMKITVKMKEKRAENERKS